MSDNEQQNSNGRESWASWQRIVLADIERNSKDIKEHIANYNIFVLSISKQLVTLQVKAAIWGAGGGALLAALLVGIFEYIVKHAP